MAENIHIVDRGRGPQLSTSRITVQDLVPYLQQDFSHAQIREVMPSLSVAEIQAVERYVQDNFEAVMAQDQRIRAREEARRQPPAVEEAERKATQQRLDAFRQVIRQHHREANGDTTAR